MNRVKNILYYILVYIVFGIIDTKFHFILITEYMFSYRFITHQIIILFTIPYIVNKYINEKNIRIISNYLKLYIKDLEKYIGRILFDVVFTNVLFFLIGQVVFFIINRNINIHYVLFMIIEILVSIIIIFSMSLYFNKNIIVYGIYYILLISGLVVNKCWISLVLTIKLLDDNILYLYLSRIIILVIFSSMYILIKNRFIRDIEGENCKN